LSTSKRGGILLESYSLKGFPVFSAFIRLGKEKNKKAVIFPLLQKKFKYQGLLVVESVCCVNNSEAGISNTVESFNFV
jgi:hypothetical protein